MQLQKIKHGTSSKKATEALEKDGAVIVEGALNSSQLEALEEEISLRLAQTPNCEGLFHGYETKRIGGMIGKSEMCQQMALDRTVLDIMDHFLLPNCARYQINLTQLISIGPGEQRQITHADDPLFPFDNTYEIMINVMWAIDDFTKENGGTHLAPGSHNWPRDRMATEDEMIQAEMPKGSYVVWLGSLRHGGGANDTGEPRRGIVMSYCLGWLRQSENQYLAIPVETVRSFPERLQELVGYRVHEPNLGMVDGEDPLQWIRGGVKPEFPAFKDHLPEDMNDQLKKYYEGA